MGVAPLREAPAVAQAAAGEPGGNESKMKSLDLLLEETAALHPHLCPRQVLGVRMGMYAAILLGLDLPQTDKQLLTIVETDGCFLDGIAVATGCRTGRRSMRIEDYGKAAATFVDTVSGKAVRIVPARASRQLALEYAPEAEDKWHAMLIGYQHIPDADLFSYQFVHLTVSLDQLISRPGRRVNCEECGEEIINAREIRSGGQILCKSCAGESYYTDGADVPDSNIPLSIPQEHSH